MNVLQTGGVTPWIAILSMLAIVCLSTSCSSTSSRNASGTAMDWSRPMNDEGAPAPTIKSTSPVIVYVPAPQVQPKAAPPATRPGANPTTAPEPMSQKPASTASGLPAPIVDDLRQANDVAPADREAFRIVPETMSTTKVYTVRKGDTLSSIARRFYGDTDAWKRIYAANRDVLPSEGEIAPGMTLRIP